MKIAYLSTDSGIPIRGQKGSSVHVRSISGALRNLGHEVRGFSPALEDDEDPAVGFKALRWSGFLDQTLRLVQEEPEGVDRVSREWRRIVFNEHAYRTLLPELAAWQPDFIYERYSLFGYLGVELAESLGVPLLLEVNSPLWQEAATYRNLHLRHTAEELEQRVLTRADHIFVVSNTLAAYTEQIGVAPEKTTVSPNGIDPALFDPALSPDATRARYDLDGKWVVGFVGSLRPWQDLDTMAEAVSLLHRANNDAHLLVVGEGQGMERLTAFGEDFVTLTGSVDHDVVPTLMSAMDAVVVPYPLGEDNYFSPMKLFEAMAMAKPIVGAEIGQVKEVLVNGVNGLHYQPGNAADLAARLQQIADSPDRGRALGQAAHRLASENHTWEANARRITTVAERLIAKGPATP